MSILPILSARTVVAKLLRAGFRYVYTKGSHYYYKHPTNGRITTVPFHGGQDIGRGLLSKIIKQAGLTIKEFVKI